MISINDQKKINSLLDELNNYIVQFLNEDEVSLVHQALNLSFNYGKSLNSLEGSYKIQTLSVALIIVKELGLGRTPLMASFIYEAAYNKYIPFDEIKDQLGDKTLIIVDGLMKAMALYKKVSTIESDNFKEFLITFSKDVRVVLIIIASRLYDMRNLKKAPIEEQKKLSKESSILYAPLAHKLGLYIIKTELEDLSLKYLHPKIYFEIASRLKESKLMRDSYIHSFIEPLKERLNRLGLKFEIKGRTKSIHSIYNKVYKQGTRFEDVYDLFAIRVILDSDFEKEKSECWQVYSVVTDMYVPNPKRLRDWLSIPKSNGYESLHTTVMGPDGKWVEVQIRTQRMNDLAENGLAAHWKYKGVKDSTKNIDQWLGTIREILEDQSVKSSEAMEDIQLDLQDDEVFIFTPKGDIKKFPKGATILDFAFDIHSQVGSKCTGAIVNGKNVTFKYELRNGDQVQLNTSSLQTPKSDWLNIVHTSRARTKIKQALREGVNKEAELGKEILKRRFKNWKLELNEAIIGKYIKKWGKKTIIDFYAAIHLRIIDPADVREVMFPTTKVEQEVTTENRTIENYVPKQEPEASDVLTIDRNLTNIMYKLAKCCNPIFGDSIFGFITTTDGIKIHKESCPNSFQMKERFPYRIVKTEWSGTSKDRYLTRLRITGNDDIGIISNVSSALSSEFRISIHSISVDSSDGIFQGMITISVENTQMLDKIIKRIAKVKGILRVERAGY